MLRSVGVAATAGIAALAVSLLVFAVPGSAAAQPPTPALKNAATGFCLDSNADKTAYTLDCNGGAYQKWTVEQDNRGVSLQNLATGFCLDSNADKAVYTLDCNGGTYQRWTLEQDARGSRLRNAATGFCLDSNEQKVVYTLDCNDGAYQRWTNGA